MSFEFLSTKCVKCAKCLPTCTVYGVKNDELNSPRGFIELLSLIDEGKSPSKALQRVINSCFLCANCTKSCPNELRIDEGIALARAKINKKYKNSLVKKSILFLLEKRFFMDIFASFGYILSTCLAKSHKNGLFFPLLKKRLIPKLNKKSFLNKMPAFIDNKGEKSVGFFVGCFCNYNYQSTAFAFLKIASKLKINVDLMKGASCCAAPHYYSGELLLSAKMAKKNIEYFEKILEKCELILIPEATCAAMIKSDYAFIFKSLKENEWALRASKVAKKIELTSTYLGENPLLLKLLQKEDKNIVYHDPCHAVNVLGVEPRALLKKSFKLIEMKRACCGFGGLSMQLDGYENSSLVGAKRAGDIKESGVKIVSAECSACKMQLENALKDTDIDFLHPLELLSQNLE